MMTRSFSQFQACLTPSSYVTLGGSIIKPFHCNLKGKVKIIQKLRPVGNEIKNLSDTATNILNMELYEGKDLTAHIEHVNSNSNSDPAHQTISQHWKKSYC